jgi:O-antigen ligase
MIANHVRNTGQIKRFLICLFLTAFIVAIVGMLQTPLGERVSAPFEGEVGEPNTFGGYLLLIGCVAAGIIAKVRDARARILLILLMVCLLPPFFLTQSRASYLGVIPAALSLAILLERKVIIAGVLAFGLILSPFFLPGIVKERILHTVTQPENPGQILIGDIRLDTSTSARLVSWREGIVDWIKKPVLGYGVTGYAFMDAQLPRVMVETGILGLAAFLYLVVGLFKMAFSNLARAETPLFKGLIIGFIAGFIGLLVHSLGANTFIIVRIMEPFWFFAGMVAVLPSLETRTINSSTLAAAAANERQSVSRHAGNVTFERPFSDAQ